MFRVSSHPSSGVHKTVTTASSTGHIIGAATSLQRGHWPRWNEVALPIDMLLSAVSVLVVAQSSSEIPEGLMNNPV